MKEVDQAIVKEVKSIRQDFDLYKNSVEKSELNKPRVKALEMRLTKVEEEIAARS